MRREGKRRKKKKKKIVTNGKGGKIAICHGKKGIYLLNQKRGGMVILGSARKGDVAIVRTCKRLTAGRGKGPYFYFSVTRGKKVLLPFPTGKKGNPGLQLKERKRGRFLILPREGKRRDKGSHFRIKKYESS